MSWICLIARCKKGRDTTKTNTSPRVIQYGTFSNLSRGCPSVDKAIRWMDTTQFKIIVHIEIHEKSIKRNTELAENLAEKNVGRQKILSKNKKKKKKQRQTHTVGAWFFKNRPKWYFDNFMRSTSSMTTFRMSTFTIHCFHCLWYSWKIFYYWIY